MADFRHNPNENTAVRRALGPAVIKAAEAVRDEARKMLDESGSGRQYENEPRRSSAPGQPPVSQSGTLSKSLVVFERASESEQAVHASVGSNLHRPRLLWLEKGTSSMAPRPLMMPAAEASKQEILQAFEGALSGGGV